MRVFDHPNLEGGFVCPICKKSTDMPVVLIPIWGTQEEVGIMQAEQVHLECLDLTITDLPNDKKLIYQMVHP